MSEHTKRAAPERQLTAALPSREEIALREVGHTDVAPGTARVLLVLFVAMIGAVPSVEWIGDRVLRAEGVESPWAHLASLAGDVRTRLAAAPADADASDHIVLANQRVLAAFSDFENALEDQSALGRALRPRAQVVLTRWLGAGNERVYKGSDEWLFFRPDVEYVTGPPFLSPRVMSRRIESASEWDRPPQPDPRPAIAQFRRNLDARGISLIVMPTPVKPSVQPEGLAPRGQGGGDALQNPSFGEFVDGLRRDGTLVFDAGEALASARRSAPQYLATDTHWRPEAMEEVAEQLARFVAAHVYLPVATAGQPDYRIERQEVRNVGDTARMLDLPDDSDLYPPEQVWLRRILHPDGSLWRSARDADVLLLGDSYANIYSLQSMGWGTSAGFAEQLSYALARPVDRLVQNDDGAFATRAMLLREPGRLEGKRLVIYQFAARELTFGDWRVLPLE